MGYQNIQLPSAGEKITVNADGSLKVPDNPIVPFIEGDGIGVDISPVMIDLAERRLAAWPEQAKVMLVDEASEPGGSLLSEPDVAIDGQPAWDWLLHSLPLS